MMKKAVLLASLVTVVLGLSACGGNDTQTTVKTTETQGKQLLDLKEAFEKGVISESEYKEEKNDILKQQ
ncbi:MAG: SHOCT domain-containing protein [Haliea sp.]|nr:SHOCT domain-containing protein [Haliea sp.]